MTERLALAVVERVVRRAITRFFSRRGGGDLRAPPAGADGLARALYLHVPYCESRCPFCAFNSEIFEPEAARQYYGALRQEMALYRDLGYSFDVLHVGGGTPTVLPSELVLTIDLARAIWPVGEVSVETNPNHLTEAILAPLRSSGVRRLSVGVQSFDDGLLLRLGRLSAYGTGRQVREALGRAAGRGISLNVDLVFDIPGQTREMLERDLAAVRSIPVDQVTFYPLMDRRRRRSRAAELFALIAERLAGDFLPATAWSFSRPSRAARGAVDEYIAVKDEYAGLGAGAFGLLRGRMLTNTFAVPQYLAAIQAGRFPIVANRPLRGRDAMHYALLMRLFRGHASSEDLARLSSPRELGLMRRLGIVETSAAGAALTERGRVAAVLAMRAFFESVGAWRAACRAMAPSA